MGAILLSSSFSGPSTDRLTWMVRAFEVEIVPFEGDYLARAQPRKAPTANMACQGAVNDRSGVPR
jgi:hypothetical protein